MVNWRAGRGRDLVPTVSVWLGVSGCPAQLRGLGSPGQKPSWLHGACARRRGWQRSPQPLAAVRKRCQVLYELLSLINQVWWTRAWCLLLGGQSRQRGAVGAAAVPGTGRGSVGARGCGSRLPGAGLPAAR